MSIAVDDGLLSVRLQRVFDAAPDIIFAAFTAT